MTNVSWKQKLAGICAVTALAVSPATAMEDLNVSGTYLGVFNSFNTGSQQFDFATNLDFEFKISDTLEGIVQLQGGNGAGQLGLVGPEVAVTDIALQYTMDDTVLTMGSFDTPFGYETGHLSNNGDTFAQPFVINPIMYSAFAGPMGTLNTLGLKAEKTVGGLDVVVSVSNGTGESAINTTDTFESLAQVSSDQIIKGLRLTGSYLHSDDTGDAGTDGNTSFESDLTGVLGEARYDIDENKYINVNYGQLNYGDNDAASDDRVEVYSAEVGYQKDECFGAIRISNWTPDSNNNGIAVSSAMATPGLDSTVDPSLAITRTQVVLGKQIADNQALKLEWVQDRPSTGRSTSGFIVASNVRF